MGYDIYIGNTKMEQVEQYADEEIETTPYPRTINGKVCYFKPVVRDEVRLPDAPTFPGDEMTGNSNNRHPGYGQWGHFLEWSGLESLFSNHKHGLMKEHPGHTTLKSWHAEEIELALASYRERYPDAVPQFGATIEDAHLARLIWLDWWVKWAVQNCEHAAIYNF